MNEHKALPLKFGNASSRASLVHLFETWRQGDRQMLARDSAALRDLGCTMCECRLLLAKLDGWTHPIMAECERSRQSKVSLSKATNSGSASSMSQACLTW